MRRRRPRQTSPGARHHHAAGTTARESPRPSVPPMRSRRAARANPCSRPRPSSRAGAAGRWATSHKSSSRGRFPTRAETATAGARSGVGRAASGARKALQIGLSLRPSQRDTDAMSDFLFTSESVSEGHPDKVADQISDAVLDAILKQDKTSRVAAETLVKDNLVVLAGEITTHARVNYDEVARNTIKRIGYTDPSIGFDASTCTVLIAYGQQSPNIARGVDKSVDLDQGAGDQGLLFGYASAETPAL